MSYFMLDTNNMNEEKKEVPMKDTEQKKTYTKARHTTPHSPEAKQKISETQSKRYDMIRQLVRKGQQKPMTEDRVKEICHEVLNEYLNRNAKPTNNNRPMNINL